MKKVYELCSSAVIIGMNLGLGIENHQNKGDPIAKDKSHAHDQNRIPKGLGRHKKEIGSHIIFLV